MLNDAGPLWLGSLWDINLVDKMLSILSKNPKADCSLKINSINKKLIKNDEKMIDCNQNYDELLKFLKTIKEESKINSAGFYDMHNIAKNKN